jgi:prepilin-type N-terminal cleavage/methylation domain-containing protein
MKTNQKGFSVVEVLLVVAVVGLLGGVGWLVYDRQQSKNDTTQSTASQTSQTDKQQTTNGQETTNAYEGMTAYSNSTYGITFYHPKDWKTEEVPIDTPAGLTPTEFAVNIKGNTTEKYAETATFEIHTNNLQETAKTYESLYAQSTTATVKKATGTLKGKESVRLTISQPDGDKTEHYLFAVGAKTYALRSINESLNVQRSQDYWSNFQKLYDSLQLK